MVEKIGLDFDNTIVFYDTVFHKYAVEHFKMPLSIAADKPSIRNYFWNYPNGKEDWIVLQGIVYGTKMSEAVLTAGIHEFLEKCHKEAVHISIVSHKTEYPARGPKVHLHEVAWKWLEENGFFDPRKYGISRDSVFFETTREKKLSRVQSQGCKIFVDDLPEVFIEQVFPPGIVKILYDPSHRHPVFPDIMSLADWKAISDVVFSK